MGKTWSWYLLYGLRFRFEVWGLRFGFYYSYYFSYRVQAPTSAQVEFMKITLQYEPFWFLDCNRSKTQLPTAENRLGVYNLLLILPLINIIIPSKNSCNLPLDLHCKRSKTIFTFVNHAFPSDYHPYLSIVSTHLSPLIFIAIASKLIQRPRVKLGCI